MAAFKDAKGKDWDIDLNFGHVFHVKSETGVDLTQIFTNEEAGGAVTQLDNFGRILPIVLDLSDEQAALLMSAMDGEAVEASGRALVEAVINFSPGPKRAALKKRWDRVQHTQSQLTSLLLNHDDLTETTSKNSPTSLRGLSESEDKSLSN